MRQAWLEALGIDQRAVQGKTPPFVEFASSSKPLLLFYYSQISLPNIFVG